MPRSALKRSEIDDVAASVKNATDISGFMSVEQVMVAFGVTRQCVINWSHRGRLHPIKVHRKLLFSPVEVEEERARYAVTKHAGRPKNPPELSKKTVEKPAPVPKTATAQAAAQPVAAASDLGKLSSDATKMFNAGKGVRDVVIELQISYELAKSIYDDFNACGPEIQLSPQAILLLRQRLNWVESPPTADGLLKAFNEHETYLIELASRPVERKTAAKSEKPLPEPTVDKPLVITEEGAKRVIPSVAEVDFGDEEPAVK